MKILHIINEARPSGAEVMLRAAGPLWAQHGIQCDVLATAPNVGPFAEQLASAGYHVHHLPRTKSPAHFLAVRQLIARHGYKGVHQHLEAAGYWYSTAALAAGAGVVRTVHNNFLFNGRLRAVRGWQRRHLARRGVKFVAIAQGVKDNERTRFGVDAQLIPNWIEQKFMEAPSSEMRRKQRSELGYTDSDFVVVSVGNCSSIKNHRLMLDALARCTELSQLKYLHVGTEDAQCSERAHAQRTCICDRVQFLGPVTDVLLALQAADAYVMPSLFEGFSIATLEAMAAGLPILLSRVDGLVDLEPIFPNILYFELATDSLAQALRRIVGESVDTRQARSVTYPGICAKFFSASRGVEDYVRMYRMVTITC